MRFLGLALADTVPDTNTIWTFREALTRATLGEKPAIEVLFRSYETALTKAGFLAMGGQILNCRRAETAQQRRREARHPQRPHPRGLEGPAREAR